jgi:hypothetical protein
VASGPVEPAPRNQSKEFDMGKGNFSQRKEAKKAKKPKAAKPKK